MPIKPTSVIILSAGFSSRMGQAKFSLKLPNGKSFLEQIAQQYFDFGCEEIIVVINPEGEKYLEESSLKSQGRLRFVVNQNPEAGRFGSVQCGVKALKTKTPIFIHNVDNPFARIPTLEKLLANLEGYDVAKPVFEDRGGHPILISKKVIDAMLNETNPSTILRSFLKPFKHKEVEVEDSSILININTMENYRRFYDI